jgi:hypothetical protein
MLHNGGLSIELREHPGMIPGNTLFAFTRRPRGMLAVGQLPVRAGLAFEQNAVCLEHHQGMEEARAQVHAKALATGFKDALVDHCALLIEHEQPQAAFERQQSLGLVLAQVPVRRNIGGR